MRQYLFPFIIVLLLSACAQDNDFRDATGPFAPPTSTSAKFLMEHGYEPVRGDIDVIALHKNVSDSVTFYFQFGEDAKKPPEFFFSKIILPKDTSLFVQLLAQYDLEIISNIKMINSKTSAFYIRNYSNYMIFNSSLTMTDSTFVLQNNYTMPYLSEIMNTEESKSMGD
jgi:hypothetical protein